MEVLILNRICVDPLQRPSTLPVILEEEDSTTVLESLDSQNLSDHEEVNLLQYFQPWCIQELKLLQRQDPLLSNIINQLEANTGLPKELEDYYLENQILYVQNDQDKNYKSKLCIREPLIEKACTLIHSVLGADAGVARTIQGTKQYFCFPSLNKHVKSHGKILQQRKERENNKGWRFSLQKRTITCRPSS